MYFDKKPEIEIPLTMRVVHFMQSVTYCYWYIFGILLLCKAIMFLWNLSI